MAVKLDSESYRMFVGQCEEQGTTASEVLRSLVAQYLTGEIPTESAGYAQAKRLGYRIAKRLIGQAYQQLPESYEEAEAML